jgi:hypothetical protein
MHKHGVKAWLLGSGTGEFPYATIQDAVDAGYSSINLKNPPLRDDFPTVSGCLKLCALKLTVCM